MGSLWPYYETTTKGNKQSDFQYNFRQVLIITISFLLNGFTVYLYLVHHLPILAINNGRQAGLRESMIQSSGEIRNAMVLKFVLSLGLPYTQEYMYVDLDQLNEKKVE